MTAKAKEEISKTLWHLHSQIITQVEAEAIIFPVIDSLIAGEAEQTKETIRNGSKYVSCLEDYPDDRDALSFWHVPDSVLASEEEK